jgi:hypothetical protein
LGKCIVPRLANGGIEFATFCIVTVAEAIAVAVVGEDLCKWEYIMLDAMLRGLGWRLLLLGDIFTETGSAGRTLSLLAIGETLLNPIFLSQELGEFLRFSTLTATEFFLGILGEGCDPLSSFDLESSSMSLSKGLELPTLLAPLLLLLKFVLLLVALGVLLLLPRVALMSGISSWVPHRPAAGISHP